MILELTDARGTVSRYELELTGEKTVLSQLLQRCGIPFDLPCGGRGLCRKCLVEVRGGVLPPDERERAMLREAACGPDLRYACMASVSGDIAVRLPHTGVSDILVAGKMPPYHLAPWGKQYGAAVDIGTTTLAGYLYRLSDGRLLATGSRPNPQSAFGADVISRMKASREGGKAELAATIRRAVGALLAEMCRRAGLEENLLDSAVLTGNTAMLYLLCARDPKSLVAVPFAQDHSFGEYLPAKELALDGCGAAAPAECLLYLPKTVSAYVGADITCSMLAVGMEKCSENTDKAVLMADIGTNGEMALYYKNRLYACSTAAGPAFEGAGLCCGMGARSGAVNQVLLKDDVLSYTVLNNSRPEGLCGSGVVDLLAALLDAGALDETGRLQMEDHPLSRFMCTKDGQPAFCLPESEVVLTQADVRAVQLAKAALAAGMLSLLHAAGIAPQQVEHFYLAGGFGNCIRGESAVRIGLIPASLAAAVTPVGNAAGIGASLLVLSKEKCIDSEKMAERTHTLELSTDPYFMDQYIEQMMFGNEEA